MIYSQKPKKGMIWLIAAILAIGLLGSLAGGASSEDASTGANSARVSSVSSNKSSLIESSNTGVQSSSTPLDAISKPVSSSESAKAESTVPPSSVPQNMSGTASDKENGSQAQSLAVHFIDVGQADAALVLCDGRAMLIDGGNTADSGRVYAYLKSLGITQLDYMVATHVHEDHVGGLAGALHYATVDTVFCPVTQYDSEAFSDFVKYLDQQDRKITVPNAGDTFMLGGAQVQILGPIHPTSEINNTSIVLRIVYGETSFLFAGDAERAEEQDILNAGYPLQSTVLKVGHHGADTSTTYPFLREIMPQYAIISMGDQNSYGHPTEAVLSRLRDAEVQVFRTDLQGHIICESDGKTVTVSVEKNKDIDTLRPGNIGQTNPSSNAAVSSRPVSSKPASSAETVSKAPAQPEFTYILNTNTKKFHDASCASAQKIKDKNRGSFTGTRDEVIANGYDPCGICRP